MRCKIKTNATRTRCIESWTIDGQPTFYRVRFRELGTVFQKVLRQFIPLLTRLHTEVYMSRAQIVNMELVFDQ